MENAYHFIVHTEIEDQPLGQGLLSRYGSPELPRTAAIPSNTDGDFSRNNSDQFKDGFLLGPPSPVYILSNEEDERDDAVDVLDQVNSRGPEETIRDLEPSPKRRRLNLGIGLDGSVYRSSP